MPSHGGQEIEDDTQDGRDRRLDGSEPCREDHIRVEKSRGGAVHSPDIPEPWDDVRLHQRTACRIATGKRSVLSFSRLIQIIKRTLDLIL